jgi:hypothetical protein
MPYNQDTGEYYEDTPSGDPGYTPTNSDWAEKRKADRRALDEKNRADALEREVAFYKAGINPGTDPRVSDFMKAYDGKLEPDAIQAAAQARGFLTPPADPPATDGDPAPDPAVQASLDAQQRAAAAATGGSPPPVDPSTVIEQAFQQGGEQALMDSLAAAGVPLAYDGRIRGS